MRLFDLRDEDILNWQMERLLVGQEKYGDAHMNRNNLVDVMEELLDAFEHPGSSGGSPREDGRSGFHRCGSVDSR